MIYMGLLCSEVVHGNYFGGIKAENLTTQYFTEYTFLTTM